jgi:hypothetical protein
MIKSLNLFKTISRNFLVRNEFKFTTPNNNSKKNENQFKMVDLVAKFK